MKKLLAALALSLALCVTAFGDMGPKDRLRVVVENPPEGAYYLDLLYEGDDARQLYENLPSEQRAALDETLLQKLADSAPEGWLLTQLDGTAAPCWGDIVGQARPDGSREHVFSYFGLPNTYRILLVTEDGAAVLTDAYTRPALQSTVYLDGVTGQVRTPSAAAAYGMQFLSTCLPTLVIEGVILCLFGCFKKNWRIFLLANVATQIVLTAVLGTAMIRGGYLFQYVFYIPLELGIMAAEAAVYAWRFKGCTKKRAVVYAVAANAASYGIGALLAAQQFTLLQSIM